MPTNELEQIARDMSEIMADLGLCAVVGDADKHRYRVAPSFKRLAQSKSGRYFALSVDLERLPRGITVSELKEKEIVEQLARRLGKPTHVLNGTGLVYLVALKFEPTKRIA